MKAKITKQPKQARRPLILSPRQVADKLSNSLPFALAFRELINNTARQAKPGIN